MINGKRVNIHAQDSFGNQALHIAARYNRYEVLEYLIQTKHFDISKRNIQVQFIYIYKKYIG